MFYSHTFLARKSPLGTVWIAAHLQHKLRKSHISVTDISTTVDCIMFPEVPIALRLSAFLLLGVVRIYAKKVDYLYRDCNDALTRVSSSLHEVDLPENEKSAPVSSITLPETFELDALDIDHDFERDLDKNLRNYEDITMTDQQIPGEGDPYVAFFTNENIRMDISPPASEIPEIGTTPMEEDVTSVQAESNVGIADPGPSNQPEELNLMDTEEHQYQSVQDPGPIHQAEAPNQMDYEDRFPQDVPDIETIRDAVATNDLPEWINLGNNVIEQEKPMESTMNEKEILSPIMEDVLPSGGESLPFQLHSDPPTAVPSAATIENLDSNVSLGHLSPEMALQPTPQVQQNRKRTRKRKQFFDTSVVLPNSTIREGLNNASALVCKRRKLPCSSLDTWNFRIRSRKEQCLFEPSICGLSTKIQDLYKKDFISSKLGTISVDDTHPEVRDESSPAAEVRNGSSPVPDVRNESSPAPEARNESSPSEVRNGSSPVPEVRNESSPAPMTGNESPPAPLLYPDMEIERIRNQEGGAPEISFPELTACQFRRDESTPSPARSQGREPQTGPTLETEVLPTLEQTGGTEPVDFDMETPMVHSEQPTGIHDTDYSEIPRMLNSPEDLDFLESDTPPAGDEGIQQLGNLSVRTSAVAQYLKAQSPATELVTEQMGNLSLNKILEGKTRRRCARMFFEILVLKSHDYIDVKQEAPYADITLSVPSKGK